MAILGPTGQPMQRAEMAAPQQVWDRMPAELRKAVNLDELGIAGTKLLAGLLYEETDPNLAGSRGMAVFREMSYDATLAMCVHATINPLRSADWFVQPASEDPKHVEQADFIHHSLWNFGSMSFDDLVRQQLKAMKVYGVGAAELIYEVIKTGRWAGMWGWEKFAWRNPISLYRFNVEPVLTQDGGTRRELVEIVQRDPASGTLLYLPKDKILLFTNNLEGENFLGTSAFRESYEAWRYKRAIGRLEAIALERAGMGRLVATLPADYSDTEAKMAKTIVENDRVHENAGIVTTEAVPVEVLHFSLEGAAFRAAWEAYDAAICFPFLTQYLLLGQRGNTGAYALSQDHSEIQLTQLNGDANQFEQVINLSPGIPLLLGINFPDFDPTACARLQHGDIGRKDMEMMGRTLLALAKGGWVLPTDQDEDTLRKFIDLPERDQALSPESLAPLIQQVLPPTWWGKPHQADEAVAHAQTITAQSGGGGMGMGGTGGGAMFSEREWAIVAERSARSRMPWRRPQSKGGRVHPDDVIRVKLGEQLLEYFDEQERRRIPVPDPPSVRLAKGRRAYELVRMASDAERVAEINALAGSPQNRPVNGNGKEGRRAVLSPTAIAARRGKGKVQTVLSGLGPSNGSRS